MNYKRFTLSVGSCICVIALTGTGCATKKYVSRTVTPIDERLKANEKRTGEQSTSIETLETGLSKTNEKVMDVNANLGKTNEKLDETSNRANQAQQTAGQAQQQAAEARQYAENRANRLDKAIENIDAYKLMKTTQVLFKVSHSELDKDAKAVLDQAVQEATAKKHYVIEVQGFTDSTGSASANLALSQRRAESVVRYLTVNHQIPLRNIHLIGTGEEAPVADNKTRDGRRQNRRVEVRLFALEFDLSSAVTPAQLR